MIDVDEAQQIVLEHTKPLGTVELPLREAMFRVLAKPVVCDVDYPPFDRSLMDGYAVRSADLTRVPTELRVVGQIAAGAVATRGLGTGESMQINTGAPIPSGADAVVRVEDTSLANSGATVRVLVTAKARQMITPRACYVTAGQKVLSAGTKLGPMEVAVAATAGAARVTVYRQPRVAILVTGDELVGAEQKLSGGQIRNSNEPMLEALVRAEDAEPVMLGIARDDRDELAWKIEEGLKADVLCITGGVSMGAFDFVPEILSRAGANVQFQKMMIKPGRPALFAITERGTLIFALPGNPASAFVGFHLLVKTALRAMQGLSSEAGLFRARLIGSMKANENRRSYWPGKARTTVDGAWEVEPQKWHGSGDVFGMACANVLIMRPPNAPEVKDGESVLALPIGSS